LRTQYYVFATLEAFDSYCRDVSRQVVHEHFYPSRSTPAERRSLLRSALVLQSQHPGLNALRVFGADPVSRERTTQLARARLRSEQDQVRFQELLEALTTDESAEYLIKYQDGIADGGGGLDVDDAVRVLGSAKATHQPFVKEMLRLHPYLEAPPPPRLHRMKAASASLFFTAHLSGRPLGERVARMLELRMLERSLSGEAVVADQTKLEKALRTLRAPSEHTKVSHTPIGGSSQHLSAPDQVQKSALRGGEQTLLGYQSGLLNDASEVEIAIFPRKLGKHCQLLLHTNNNGDGQEPFGVKPLRSGGELLWQPAVFTVIVESDSRGKETKWLRRVETLQVGEQRIVTSCPSTVLPGAFIGALAIKVVRIASDAIQTDLGKLTNVGGRKGDIDSARTWIASYQELCAEMELGLGDGKRQFRYLRPAGARTPSPLHRIIATLDDLGGTANPGRLLTRMDELFKVRVRWNNTKRDMQIYPEFVRFDDELEMIELRPPGRRYLAAYRRAIG
jgi:hypothetical protein